MANPVGLCRQGRPRLRQDLDSGTPETVGAARPEDAALREADRPPGRLVEPKLLAEIEYRAKSAEGKVRPRLFKGLREDL